MKVGIYSVRDSVAENFGSVTIDTNDMTAKRNFGFAINNTDQMTYSADDLELYKVGEFDMHTGIVTNISPIVMICRGSELIAEHT